MNVTKIQVDQELASRLRLVVTRLARRLRQQAADEGLSPSMLSALATVERRGPVSLGDLAAIERVQPPSMTRIVARLDGLGLVEREASPTDRRVGLVRLSDAGRVALQRNRKRRTAYLASRLRKLSTEDLIALEEALPVLERLVEDEA